MSDTIKKQYFIKWLIRLMAIFLIIISISCLSWLALEFRFKDKIFPGIYVGNISLGGFSYEQAQKLLNQKIDKINQNGIKFSYHDQETNLLPIIASVESDLAYQIFNFNIDKNLDQAYSTGRSENFINNLKEKIRSLISKKYIPAYFEMNETEVNKFLLDNFSRFSAPAEDAKLIYAPATWNSPLTFDVQEEKFGQAIEYNDGLKKLKTHLSALNDSPITLTATIDYPLILKKDALNIDAKAKDIYNKAPIYLLNDKQRWIIHKTTLIDWLALKAGKEASIDKIAVGIDHNIVKTYFEENIEPDINQEPIEGKFDVNEDGKVTEFQVSRNGISLDIEESLVKLEQDLLNTEDTQINLITRIEKSKASTEDINDLGIKEILGIGHSDFSGSPKNRRHNIAIGASSVNGSLIAPGEEFSLIGTLGSIDGEAGYLPELVIKDNKTIPEFGGGLCQIGTTMFRGTYASGLPVTMRRNHSYRVSYYEPAGTDATIYDPWPDYRFKNDTGTHVLIQSRIEGNDLYFEFWGTKDGRTTSTTEPTIYNISKPGPTKIIETKDLEPGIKKCTEHAHNGADAYFDYTVKYSSTNPPEDAEDENDLLRETRFKSHYVPWREVCLLGVEELTSEKKAKEKTASSTKETVIE